jgi:arginine:pyruvate transaminase
MPFDARFSRTTARLDAGADTSAWAVHDRAVEMQREGEDVILLCVGDPNFDTPPLIFGEALAAMRAGRTHYSPAQGEYELRCAIAEVESRTSPHPCGPDEVVVFPGGTNAIYSIATTLLDVDDEVVIPEPMYVGYTALFQAVGARVVGVPLIASRNFALDVEAMKAAVTPRTRAMLVNTPGNPAGNMIDPGQLAELAAYCRERGLWMICDEVYSMITFKRRHMSLRASAAELDNLIMIDALSKSHAMSGWRIGWTVSPADVADRLARFNGATLFGCSQFIQDAAAYALRNDDVHVEKMRLEYLARRDLVVARVDAIPGLRCDTPDAGMFVMIDVAGTGRDGARFAQELFAATGVSTVPGAGFGPSAHDYVRLTLAQDRSTLGEAFDRIEGFVNRLNAA